MKLAEGDDGGEGAYTGPGSRQSSSASLALSLRAPNLPISLAVADGAQYDPAAAAAGAASSITRRMPSGRALPAAPAASQPPTGPETPYIHTALGKGTGVCSALLPVQPPAPGSSGQRGIRAEKTPAAAAAAARKRRPGGCSYAPLPTPSGCNALGSASARLLPACAGLVSAAVCRCGSSPSPRRPPPRSAQLLPPPWGLKMRGPIYSGVAWASIRSAEAVAILAPSARVRMRGSERSGSAPPAPRRNPGRTRASERTEDSDTALGLPTPGAPIPSGLRLLPHQGSNKSFWPRGQRRSFSFPEECAGGASSPRFPPTMERASLVLLRPQQTPSASPLLMTRPL
uniref:Uncharacterized protein n=2 Tax=Rangifer tarandus platyrhynchus TaxID=3082113 RepID=A0ACB0F9Q7_RANTA|nr:unnamed protein product [Rangifer tarandus platyrhynchus]